MPTISLRLSEELDSQLDRAASAAERPKSELIRDAILAFLEREQRERFQQQLIRAVHVRGAAAAVAVAQEFLRTDNEALNLAESGGVSDVRSRYRVKPRSRR